MPSENRKIKRFLTASEDIYRNGKLPWNGLRKGLISEIYALHKKWRFPLKISLVNVTKSAICLRIASHLLKESLMENFIFLAVMFTLRFRQKCWPENCNTFTGFSLWLPIKFITLFFLSKHNAFLGPLQSTYDFPNLTLLCLKYT